MRIAKTFALLVVLSVTACFSAPSLPEGARVRCDDDRECPAPLSCESGECVAPGQCPAPEHACLGSTETCAPIPFHERCAPIDNGDGTSDQAYCDVRLGCSRGRPCTEDSECDDGFDCNGQEVCRADHCVGDAEPPVLDDDNPCTEDGCDALGAIVHDPLPDGASCTVEEGRAGECIAAVCTERPPSNPLFRLVDPASGSSSVSASLVVDVVYEVEVAGYAGYLMKETDSLTQPATDDPAWQSASPTTFTLSGSAGARSVVLWVVDAQGRFNPDPTRAVIDFIDGEPIRVGPTANGCPVGEDDVCDYHFESDATPLTSAVLAAPSAAVIWIFDAPTPYADRVFAETPITIEPGPGQRPTLSLLGESITLRNGATLRDVRIEFVGQGIPLHVSGGVVERVELEAVTTPFDGVNSTEFAMRMSGGVFRDSIIRGWFEEIELRGGEFTHNTVVCNESSFRVSLDNAVVVTENVFESTSRRGQSLFVVDSGATPTVGGNVLFGYQRTDSAELFTADNTDLAPGFVDYDRLEPSAESALLDQGLASGSSGVDVYGRARSGVPDVGAVESTGASALGGDLRVGTSAGCDGPCDIVGDPLDPGFLPSVMRRAPPGAIVSLFPDESGRFAITNVLIDRPLTLQAGGGRGARDVLLAGTGADAIDIINGDNVVLERLSIACDGCGDVVRVDGAVGGSLARLDRIAILGEGNTALEIEGAGVTVDNVVIVGEFIRLLRGQSPTNLVVRHMSAYSTAQSSESMFDLREALNFQLLNTLVVSTRNRTVLRIDSGSAFVDGLYAFGVDELSSSIVLGQLRDPSPVNNCQVVNGVGDCPTLTPGFSDPLSIDDMIPDAGGAGIDRADPSVANPSDFDGTPRPQGAAPDIGAFER